MSHFAKVENGIVTQVIVAEQDVIDSGVLGVPSNWIQTSYNTHGGIHYGQDGQPDGGVALRMNYAGIGYTYDGVGFAAPKPFQGWILDTNTYCWNPPIPKPVKEGFYYLWNEATEQWGEHEVITTSTNDAIALTSSSADSITLSTAADTITLDIPAAE